MRMIRNALVGTAALLGLAGAALATERQVMTVALPSGGVAHIAYEGKAPPVVRIVPVTRLSAWDDPLAGFDRLMAEMRARHVALMRQAAALAAQARAAGPSDRVEHAVGGHAPAGSYSYTYISTSTGNGTCGRMVEVTSRPGAEPRRISRTFGECAESAAPEPIPAAPARPAERPALPTI